MARAYTASVAESRALPSSWPSAGLEVVQAHGCDAVRASAGRPYCARRGRGPRRRPAARLVSPRPCRQRAAVRERAARRPLGRPARRGAPDVRDHSGARHAHGRARRARSGCEATRPRLAASSRSPTCLRAAARRRRRRRRHRQAHAHARAVGGHAADGAARGDPAPVLPDVDVFSGTAKAIRARGGERQHRSRPLVRPRARSGRAGGILIAGWTRVRPPTATP